MIDVLSRRCGRAVRVEILEPRQLLAAATSVAIADYEPRIAGITRHYTGTDDGASASETETTAIDTLDGQTVLRTDNTLTRGSETPSTSREYSSLTKDGLRIHLVDGRQGSQRLRMAFATPLKILSSRVSPGDLLPFSNVPMTVTVTDEGDTFKGSATMTGSTRVEGFERIDLPDGRFFPAALKITQDYTFTMVIKRNGVTATFKDHLIEISWLARGIGTVATKSTGNSILSTDDDRQTESHSGTMTLDSSSLLPPETSSLSNGVLNVTGAAGADVIDVSAGNKQIIATTNGVARAYSAASVNFISISAGAGNDVVGIGANLGGVYVDAGLGDDRVFGGSGKDTLTGGAGRDYLDGRAGDDRINGSGGHDRLVGSEGNDRLYGGNESDQLEGGSGVDRLFGGAGDDLLSGGGSNDKLYGEAGADTLAGGDNDDILDGGLDVDSLLASSGNDQIVNFP